MPRSVFLCIIIAKQLHYQVCGEQINHINFVDYIPQQQHKNLFICSKHKPDMYG